MTGPDDSLSHACDDRRLTRAAHVSIEVRAHGDARLHVELDAVLRDALKDRRLDDPWSDRRLERFEHVTPRQVDGRRPLPLQRNLRTLGRDHGQRHLLDAAARQIVRLHLVDGQRQAGLACAHEVRHDDARLNPHQPHADERDDREWDSGRDRADPHSQQKVVQEEQEPDDDRQDHHRAEETHSGHQSLLTSPRGEHARRYGRLRPG